MMLFINTSFAMTTNLNPDPDPVKEYFKTARFNESPQGIVFKELLSIASSNTKIKEYFVIYTSNEHIAEGGAYIKFSFDEKGKLVQTSYFSKDDSAKTKQKLEEISFGALTNNFTEIQEAIDAGVKHCEEACDRREKCYDKPTEPDVTGCAVSCILSCM
ncbi:hypothetical protein BAX95_09665 [Elizabethkingia meningoseptica]|uniref:hypothetical protein n=1 Tax=Elizabethkingia meningoseptica TaxID=238 RepID=UPI0008417434|nr:hypothetical protein [Elizabethkingia meningoseptica]MDE5430589.1 hypothetical protein [Elizabethkingia meningoseptica]ODM55032.1 hypothetical protein BES09_00795 [Elizabethkingia meningoseptica]OHT30238.1 hypothetical protein BFF93_00800 [Elizabethkingia meningoseptica]OPC11911.1 hypothetical protein BAX93_05255 [Elizabethkingia meningoseptica]OPC20628.1 hypothetical protein BAX95_09665 [Elizabethkingia meningoseptica]